MTFQDFKDGAAESKAGYNKIRFCGEQACRDGLSYFWVDTCCIDKSSSAGLSEAINSMLSWHHGAVRCYVCLADVSGPDPISDSGYRKRHKSTALSATHITQLHRWDWEPVLLQSRWFTRGWTLQELLAPSSVEFFTREGARLGCKTSLEQLIRERTQIPVEALRGTPLLEFEVSERLAWVKSCETIRGKGKAYALLGLFDVYMLLIYGEGKEKAFRRLQEEIRKGLNKECSILSVASDAIYNSRAEEHKARCHSNTRVELLCRIEAWVTDPNGKCVFWLNGMAGTGKSTVSRTVAERLSDQGVLGGSFLFQTMRAWSWERSLAFHYHCFSLNLVRRTHTFYRLSKKLSMPTKLS